MEDNNQQQNQNGQQNYTQPQNEYTNQNYTKQSNENINQNYNGQPNGYANQNYTAQPNEYANPNYAQPNYAQPQNGYTQANYAQQQYNNPQVEEKKESGKAPVILRILSFFIPLLGLILFIANISENKRICKILWNTCFNWIHNSNINYTNSICNNRTHYFWISIII